MEPHLTDIAATRLFLKKNFDGPEVVKALRFRLETHLKDPTLDPLSNQVWRGYQELPKFLKEPFSILDAGCMSGFLYHHLKKSFTDFKYVGMDRWPEALEAGREFAPGVEFMQKDFLLDDLTDIGTYDYIVCSNIPFQPGEAQTAMQKLLPHKRRMLLFIDPGSNIYGIE